MAYTGNTTTGPLDVTIRNYYDRVALLTLQKNLVLDQFATRKPLPGNSGATIFWNRFSNFAAVTTTLTEGTPPANTNISATAISATVFQIGATAALSDLIDMTSINDDGKATVERQAYQAAQSIDGFIRREIYNTSNDSACPTAPNTYYQVYDGVTYGNVSALPSTSGRMSTAIIRRAVTTLRSAGVPAVEGNDYVLVVSPATGARLRADSVWQNANQYSGVYAEKIFAGEAGRIEGARVIESSNMPIFGSGSSITPSTSDTSAYASILIGAGAYGMTELEGGLQTYLVQGADKSDPLNQESLYGWKMTFVPKTLNYSCAVVVITTD